MNRIKDYLYLISVLFDRKLQNEAIEEQAYEQYGEGGVEMLRGKSKNKSCTHKRVSVY